MKVSVITATYNLIENGRETYFRQMIASVRRQTYKNVEHIVIDGGSTDGTVEILQEMSQAGLIKYISEKDSGIYDAMNKGAKLAEGELITFLNSDDYFSNHNGLEKSVKVFSEDVDYSYTPVTVVDEDKNFAYLGRIKWLRLLRNMPFPHPGMLVRKSVFQQLGGFDTSFRLVGDYDFILRLILAGHKGKQVTPFVTFRAGGATDVYADKHKSEMARVYEKNYASLAGLNAEDCAKIAETYVFPDSLIKVLIKGNYLLSVKLSALYIWLNSKKRQLKERYKK